MLDTIINNLFKMRCGKAKSDNVSHENIVCLIIVAIVIKFCCSSLAKAGKHAHGKKLVVASYFFIIFCLLIFFFIFLTFSWMVSFIPIPSLFFLRPSDNNKDKKHKICDVVL